jgi:glycosyltransferase involved in cell wall biosynthesis
MVVFKASQIICISDHGLNYLRNSYSKLKAHINIFRLGTIDHGISTAIPGKRLKVVSCSVIDANKRVVMIAKAINSLNIAIEWTHIGDGPLMPVLKRELATGMNDNVLVNLPGKILNEQVHEIYKNEYFDLFINLSASEGVPFAIMEALSYSIPVLATAVGGIPELINDSCGKLLDKNPDIEAVKTFISYFNELNSSERSAYRVNSRKRWEQLCNAEKNYNEFVTFLKKL